MSSFIKEILLPEKIDSYYLFSKIVIGIEINKTNIIATKTRIKGRTSTIELITEEKIAEEVSEEDFARTSPALTALFAKLGSYDEIHSVIPSSIVVFKELKLPFTSRDKIAMVVGFEIEPLLPFPLRESVIDFIITREIPEEKSTEILVTAVQKQHIIEHLAAFQAVELKPTVITTDSISLYGLYQNIPAYKQIQGGSVILSITGHTTSIALMINGQLKTVRSLQKGIIALTKQIGQDLNKSPQEIIDHLVRFGVEAGDDAGAHTAIEKALSQWWEAINFTLTSFSTQLLNGQPMSKIIFIGAGTLIKGLPAFIEKKTTISCELFSTHSIEDNKDLTVYNNNLINPVNIISASATLPFPSTVDYNVMLKETKSSDTSLLFKQLLALALLTLCLFATGITHYYIQTSKLSAELNNSEKEALNALTSNFDNLESTKILDEEIIQEAEKEVKEQKERWFAFSNQSRTSFLQYLLELSKIDRKTTELKVEQISLSEGILTIKAEVKDHIALQFFEEELRKSKLLKDIESSPETPQFTIRILLGSISEENL